MPRIPKPDHLRQRRNRIPGAATLPTAETAAGNEVPPLPAREPDREGLVPDWHPKVVEWWESVWRSPMASEYLDADMKGGLYLLADLHQLRWMVRDTSTLKEVAAEIRLQEVRFGLSPIDRSRLRWEVSRAEEAEERQEARRKPKTFKDPRGVLKVG